MKTLRDLLLAVPKERIVLTSPQRALRIDQLIGKGSPVGLVGRSVAICSDDIATALKWLVALDGSASNILLLSANFSADLALSLTKEAGCEVLLTCRDDIVKHADEIEVCSSLDDIQAHSFTGAAARFPTTWILTTSGTTGRPKLVAHTLQGLTRTTKIDQSRGAGQTWAMLYDYTRFAGLQVVLQAVLSGAELAAPPIDETLRSRVAFFVERQCTHVSCTPTLWRKLLMVPEFSYLPLRQATLGGEIADNRILAAIREQFPRARVTHIYASTEAGVGFSVSDQRAGFPASFLGTWEAGVGLRLSSGGILEIQTNPVSGWINTLDRVEVLDDRVLFLGRDNGAINVGGDKVYPEEVEVALLEHDEILAARVYGRDSPIVGAVVCAEVQVSQQLRQLGGVASEVRRFLSKRLPRHKIPAIVKVVDNIQVTSAGKIERNVS